MLDVPHDLKGRDFTRIAAWSRAELTMVLDLADAMKRMRQAYEPTPVLPRRTVAMIFQKPSTRTRVSFEAGIAELGGTALYLASRTSSSAAASRSATRPTCCRGTSTAS